MAAPATFADGTKTTEHHSVSLEKQRSTDCQQSSNDQRWNNVSSKPFGLEGAQQQERHFWASAAKLSEQEQSDACSSQTSITNKCLTSSEEQDTPWHHHQHHKHNYNHRWYTQGTSDSYTSTNRWTTTSTKSNSGHANGISNTSIGQLTNGHSTNKLSQQPSNAITTKATPGR